MNFGKASYTSDLMCRATALIRFEPGQKMELDAVLHRMQGLFMDAHSMVRGAGGSPHRQGRVLAPRTSKQHMEPTKGQLLRIAMGL